LYRRAALPAGRSHADVLALRGLRIAREVGVFRAYAAGVGPGSVQGWH